MRTDGGRVNIGRFEASVNGRRGSSVPLTAESRVGCQDRENALSMSFAAVDVETANADLASICQVGIVRFSDGEVQEQWQVKSQGRQRLAS